MKTGEPQSPGAGTNDPPPAGGPNAHPGPAVSRKLVIPHRLSWPKRLLATAIYALIRTVSATMRYHFDDRAGLFTREPPPPTIFCIWHNRLALSLMLYVKGPKRSQPTRRLAAMVSASRDGAVVADLLERFGAQPVRGSSSRRGPQALLELTTWAERGYDLAITPDGPRGPRYVVQPGVVALARLTGLPIVPVCYRPSWKIQAKSWDRFQIPLPFGRIRAVFGHPIQVPRDLSDAQSEEWRRRVEDGLRAITLD